MSDKMKWWLYGAGGALLFGSGLSIAMECSHLKHSDYLDWWWILGGTAGIGIALSGVVFLIRAGILQYHMYREN